MLCPLNKCRLHCCCAGLSTAQCGPATWMLRKPHQEMGAKEATDAPFASSSGWPLRQPNGALLLPPCIVEEGTVGPLPAGNIAVVPRKVKLNGND